MKYLRPQVVKVFASKASKTPYVVSEYGSNIAIGDKSQYAKVANDGYLKGVEFLDGKLDTKALSSVLFYLNSLIAYTYQRGVPEFSPHEHYVEGSVVMHKNQLWISKKDMTGTDTYHGSFKGSVEPMYGSVVRAKAICAEDATPTIKPAVTLVTEPSEANSDWDRLLTRKDLDDKVAALEAKLKLLEAKVGK